MRQLTAVTIIALFTSAQAFARAPDHLAELMARNPDFAQLSLDLGTEVQSFDDFQVPALHPHALRFAREWKKFLADPLHSPDPMITDPLPEIPAVSGLPEVPIGPSPSAKRLKKLSLDVNLRNEPHSISDISNYVTNRLGDEATAMIRSGRVKPIVYAGSETDALRYFKGAIRIPSIYENWGVAKFLAPNQRLIYVIPPIREYAEHYGDMILLAGGHPKVLLNLADRAAEMADLAQSSGGIVEKLGGRADYVILGYARAWNQLLRGALEKESVSLNGITGNLYVLDQLGSETRIVTLASSRTLWGEASAALVKGILPYRPRAVLFMGSSGGLSNRVSVYGKSVPAEFLDRKGRKIPISNLLFDPERGQRIIHGNTSSPAEETISKVDRWLGQGVDSVDVEQSLVAKSIANYNRENAAAIRFGAVDLITDLPASTELGRRVVHDLDHVDVSRKVATQAEIVKFAFRAIHQDQLTAFFSDCERLLLPAGAESLGASR